MVFFLYFSEGGTGVPCHPSLALMEPICTVCRLFIWLSYDFFDVVWRGFWVVERGGWCGDTWSAYLKRFIHAPSSHWGICTLIRFAGTLDTCKQRWVARTKVTTILLLMYPHVLKQGCGHIVWFLKLICFIPDSLFNDIYYYLSHNSISPLCVILIYSAQFGIFLQANRFFIFFV